MNNRTWDAIIIGGGIHGVSLAYHLVKKGIKPLILEKNFSLQGRQSGPAVW